MSPLAAAHPGTPFLEGPTVTVAGATLLQRVAAVASVGGTIQSSQVDALGTQAGDGLVGLVVSCEMEQPALQKLLYDLEAGMPFLFKGQDGSAGLPAPRPCPDWSYRQQPEATPPMRPSSPARPKNG